MNRPGPQGGQLHLQEHDLQARRCILWRVWLPMLLQQQQWNWVRGALTVGYIQFLRLQYLSQILWAVLHCWKFRLNLRFFNMCLVTATMWIPPRGRIGNGARMRIPPRSQRLLLQAARLQFHFRCGHRCCTRSFLAVQWLHRRQHHLRYEWEVL